MLVYNVASRKMTLGKQKGQTMYYAQAAAPSRLSSRAVEDLIVEKTSLTRGDIRHAITSLAEVIQWALSEGIAVDLADLGSFKVEQSSKMVANKDEVNASILNSAKVRFYPRHAMRERAKSVGIIINSSAAPKPTANTGGRGGSTSPASNPSGTL